MKCIALIRENWFHFFLLGIILAIELSSTKLYVMYYEKIKRPSLLAVTEDGVTVIMKNDFVSSAKEHARADFDFLIVHEKSESVVTETYYFKTGDFHRLLFIDGQRKLTTRRYPSHIPLNVSIFIGIVMLISVGWIHGFRTGQWFYGFGAKFKPFNRLETMLLIYGGSILTATFFIEKPAFG